VRPWCRGNHGRILCDKGLLRARFDRAGPAARADPLDCVGPRARDAQFEEHAGREQPRTAHPAAAVEQEMRRRGRIFCSADLCRAGGIFIISSSRHMGLNSRILVVARFAGNVSSKWNFTWCWR
jgi:hypothetical protein